LGGKPPGMARGDEESRYSFWWSLETIKLALGRDISSNKRTVRSRAISTGLRGVKQ